MTKAAHLPPRLPLPKWAMVLIAIPTFYIPAFYLGIIVWVLVRFTLGKTVVPPPLLATPSWVLIGALFALAPFYIVWIAASHRLTWSEKVIWMLLVVVLNVIGAAMFYVFVTRRYLGLDQRAAARDEEAAALLLHSCGMRRSAITVRQWRVLVRYCRRVRLYRWCVVVWLLVAAVGIYLATCLIPHQCLAAFSGSVPADVVIVDRVRGSMQTYSIPRDMHEQFVEAVMLTGATAGVIGSLCLLSAASLAAHAWTSFHRRAFLEFLRGASEM